jgi:hypothetical protein
VFSLALLRIIALRFFTAFVIASGNAVLTVLFGRKIKRMTLNPRIGTFRSSTWQ